MRRTKAAALEAAIAAVEAASDRNALMPLWHSQFDRPPPHGISVKMIKLAIAYQLQAIALGSLKPTSVRYMQDVVSKGSLLICAEI